MGKKSGVNCGTILSPIELELENVNVQYNAEITKEDVTMQLRKIAKWKELVLDGIQWF